MYYSQHKWYSALLLSMCILLFIVLFTSGCATIQPNPNNPIARVAVLPMINNSNDIDGPVFVRGAVNNMIAGRFYETVPLEKIDESLKDKMGITLGGQLDFSNPGAGAPSPQQIGELLEVDGVFYGTLIEFKQIITGVYNKRKVKAKLKLVNAKTGEVVWENEAEHSNSEFNLSLSSAAEAAMKKVVGTAIDKSLKLNPLAAETNTMASKLTGTLPPGPVIRGR